MADYLLERLDPEEDGSPGRTGVDPALGELAKLEATLARLDVADGEAGAVTARLESLLATWKATRNLAGGMRLPRSARPPLSGWSPRPRPRFSTSSTTSWVCPECAGRDDRLRPGETSWWT